MSACKGEVGNAKVKVNESKVKCRWARLSGGGAEMGFRVGMCLEYDTNDVSKVK